MDGVSVCRDCGVSIVDVEHEPAATVDVEHEPAATLRAPAKSWGARLFPEEPLMGRGDERERAFLNRRVGAVQVCFGLVGLVGVHELALPWSLGLLLVTVGPIVRGTVRLYEGFFEEPVVKRKSRKGKARGELGG